MADEVNNNPVAAPAVDLTALEDEGTASAAEPAAAAEEDAGGATFFDMLETVPETIRKYLVSKDIADARAKIYKDFGLGDKEQMVVMHTDLEVFFGDLDLKDFPDELWSRLPWKDEDEEKARKLALELLGHVFLPAQAHVGDVAGLIAELGGDYKAYPEKQLEMRRVTFSDGAREIADAVPLEGLNEDMRKRLMHIVDSRLRVIRDDMETKEMLMKSKKTGGMELSDADAAKVMDMLASRMRMTTFTEAKEEKKSPDERPLPEAPAAPAAAGSPAAPAKEFTAIDIKRVYTGTQEEQEGLKKRMTRFAQVTEGDSGKMRDAFFQVLFPPDLRPTDPLYVVAGLVVMSDGDRFSEAVVNDERYRNILRDFLKDKGREDEMAAYEEDPIDPRFMNILLQMLLRGIAGYDEAQSARFGLRVVNALKKQGYDRYADLVAFDMDKGAFRWKEPIEL